MKKLLCTLWVCMMVCMSLHANITITFTPDHPRQSFVLNKDCSQCTVSLKSQKDKTCAFTIYDHAGQEVSAKDGKKIHFISSGTKVFYTLQAGEHYTVDSHLDPGDQGFTIVIDDSEGTAATLDQMRAGAVELPASAQGRYLVDAPITSGSGTELTDHAWYRISYSDVRPAMIYAEGVARLSMRLVAYNASTGELTEVGTRTTYNLDNLYTYAFDQSGAEYYLLLRSRDQIGWVDYPLVCKPQEELRPYWEACANEAPTVSESRGYLSFHTEPSDQIGLMGYRWYKFVPQYTGKYSISTVNTSGDLINGVNKPCALLLDANLDILGSAYQNDPTNLTEFLLQYDMEAGTTYYLLVKDYDNIAGSTRINITCQKWVDEQPKDTEDGLMSITFTPEHPQQSFVLNHNYRLCSISVLTQKDDICSITVRDRQGNEIAASDGQTKHFISKTTPVHYVFHPGELYIIDSHLGADDRGFTIEMIGRDGTPATIEEMSARAAGNDVLGRNIYSAKSVPIVEGDGSKLTDYVWYKVDPSGLSSISFASGAGKYGMKVVVYGLVKHEPSNPVLLPTYSMDYIEQGTTKYYNLDPIISYDFNYQSDFNGDMPEQSEPQYYLLLRAEDKIGKVDFSIVSQQDPSYYGPSSTLWYNSSKTAETVEEGTSEVSFRYENKAGQGFLGYTWYKLVSDFTDHYTIKTINTSPDPINGRNEPAMLLLDADGNILKQAHRNDPESPTECRIEHDMVEGTTYYILVKDYANIAEPTRMSITCPTWELLVQKAKTAPALNMGKNQITLASVKLDEHHPYLAYDWYKFVPPYTDTYTHYYPKDVALDMIWLDENLQVVTGLQFTEGNTYYLLMRKSDGTEYALRTYLDCPKQLEYDKANVYPEQFGAETLTMGVNLLNIPAIEDTYGYRADFNYHGGKIVPTAITDYYFFTDGPVEYKLYDQNLNLVTKYRLARRPYYVLYRRTDLSATPEGKQDMLYVNSIAQITSDAKTFDLGENTFTTEAVHPSLKDEIFGYNIVKYIPRISGDYYFYTSEGLEYKLFDSNLKPITKNGLTANSSVYIGYRRKDLSATPEGKQDTLYICCRESFVADCESFTEGENVFTTSAVSPLLKDAIFGYNIRMFVPKYTSGYYMYASDSLEYKVLDSKLNPLTSKQLTKDATYYIVYRLKDLSATPEGKKDTLYICCRENFVADCELFAEGENVFTTSAITPQMNDLFDGYNVRKFVPKYTSDYYFYTSDSLEYKVLENKFNPVVGKQLTKDATYYIVYRLKDLSATPEGKQDTLYICCRESFVANCKSFTDGENVFTTTASTIMLEDMFDGYNVRKFVPQYTSDYYFYESELLEYKILDSKFNPITDKVLDSKSIYYILYQRKDLSVTPEGEQDTLSIYCARSFAGHCKYIFFPNENVFTTPAITQKMKDLLGGYNIRKLFLFSQTEDYNFYASKNLEYKVLDNTLTPVTGNKLLGYRQYYIVYRRKDLNATPEGEHDTLQIYSHSIFVDGCRLIHEGENTFATSAISPLIKDTKFGYNVGRFVPKYTDDYYLYVSKTLEYKLLDNNLNPVTGSQLKGGDKYYIVYRRIDQTATPEGEKDTLFIDSRSDISSNLAKYLSIGDNFIETADINPLKYDDMAWKGWCLAKLPYDYYSPGTYKVFVDDRLEYQVVDRVWQPQTDDYDDSSMFIFYRPKDNISTETNNPYNIFVATDHYILPYGKGRFYAIDGMNTRLSFPPEYVGECHIEFSPGTTYTRNTEYGYNDFEIHFDDNSTGWIEYNVYPESVAALENLPEVHVGKNMVKANMYDAPLNPRWYSFTPSETASCRFVCEAADISVSIFDMTNGIEGGYTENSFTFEEGHHYYLGFSYMDYEYFVTGVPGKPFDELPVCIYYAYPEIEHRQYTPAEPRQLTRDELLALETLPDEVGAYASTADDYTAYLISTPEELVGFGRILEDNAGTNYIGVIANDLQMNSEKDLPTYQGVFVSHLSPYDWEPINRKAEDSETLGDIYLVGQGNVIHGLYSNGSIYDETIEDDYKYRDVYPGLFAEVSNLHAYDLGIEQASFRSNDMDMGSFVARATNSTFDGCWAKDFYDFTLGGSHESGGMVVYPFERAGGLVGWGDGVSFTNCLVDIDIPGMSHKLRAWGGGLIGNLTNSYSKPCVIANNYVCNAVFSDVFVYKLDCTPECTNNYYGEYNHGTNSNTLNATQAEHPETGEYAYRLQGSQERHYWGQYIGRDPHPVLHSSLCVAYDADEDRYYNPVVGDYNGDGTVDMADVTTLRDIVIEKQGDKHHVGSLTNTKHYEKPHIADIPLLIDILKK